MTLPGEALRRPHVARCIALVPIRFIELVIQHCHATRRVANRRDHAAQQISEIEVGIRLSSPGCWGG